MREWLCERGVERMTLLVIPARDLHPLAERSPEMVRWLSERRHAGDSIAQHGFQHAASRTSLNLWRRAAGRRADEAEFAGLDADETRRAVDAGRRVLKLAGIEPRGFVAPGYMYTPALREALAARFQWWAELNGICRVVPHAHLGPHVVSPGGLRAPQLAERRRLSPPLSTPGPVLRQPALSRALGRLASRSTLGRTAALRLDVNPGDLDDETSLRALERALRRIGSGCQPVVTYDELALGESSRPQPNHTTGRTAIWPYRPVRASWR